MRFALAICAIFLAVLVSGMEQPAHEQTTEPSQAPTVEVHGERHKRFTCDVLSINTLWGSLGHAACAGHCLIQNKGFKGGYCDGHGICNCRY